MADKTKPKRTLSPEGRQHIIDAQKKRWAGKKAAEKKPKKRGPSVAPTVVKPAKKAAKRTVAPLPPKQFAEGYGGAIAAAVDDHLDKLDLKDQLEEAKARIERIESDLDQSENSVDDLRAILEREYQYHSLRAEELERELERYDVEID